MISTGLPQLDEILGGGFPSHTVILLCGGPGTGKTLFSLNFLLEGAERGERCCYLTLMENKSELLRACKAIERLKKVEKYVDKNFVIQELTLTEKNFNSAAFDLKQFVKLFNHYPKIERIVIDNVNKLLLYAKDKREYRRYFSELVKELKKRFLCSLIICETDGIDTGSGEAYECDGVIKLSFLELEEKPKRILEIYKLRYANFEPRVPHEFTINEKGLKLEKTAVI